MEDLIPLFVEDDLKARQRSLVSDHLKSCGSCAVVAREYRESQRWLRQYVPREFDASFFEEIGKQVRARVGETSATTMRDRILSRFWSAQLAVAGAALLVLLCGIGFLILRRGATEGGQGGALPTARSAEDVRTSKDDIAKSSRRQLDQTPATVPIQRASHWRAHKTAVRAPAGLMTASDIRSLIPASLGFEDAETAPADSKEPQLLRIYIQTSDPNVRIIWLVPKPVDGD